MNCKEAEGPLWAYYDGQCAPPLREALETHLRACSQCRAAVDAWGLLARKIFPPRAVQAPPFLWTRVLAGIEAAEQKRAISWWGQWRWMGQATAAVALLVFLGAGFVLYQSTEGLPIDLLLQGQNEPANAMRLSRNHSPTQTEVTAWILGGKPWEDD